MTCSKHTALRGTKEQKTKAAAIERLMRAVDYMLGPPEILATRANTTRVAKRFWVHPKSLQMAMRMMAEEDLNV